MLGEVLSWKEEGSQTLISIWTLKVDPPSCVFIDDRLQRGAFDSQLAFSIFTSTSMRRIDDICRYKTEEYSADATYEFNIYPEQIPLSLMDSIPEDGTPKQNEAIFNLIKTKCDDLIGKMPLKICYPALEREDWHMITVLGHIIMEALALCLCLVHIGMHQARKTKIGQEGSSLGGEENFL